MRTCYQKQKTKANFAFKCLGLKIGCKDLKINALFALSLDVCRD